MVSIQSGTRLMVAKGSQLLGAHIQWAQTRHISRRHQRLRPPMPEKDPAVRDREKTEIYNENKRRSMWEQVEVIGERVYEQEDHEHRDANQNSVKAFDGDRYERTWANFPENIEEEKQENTNLPEIVEEPPRRRRSQSDRPSTAKPFSDEAIAFIDQDKQTERQIRIKAARSVNASPTSVMKQQSNHFNRKRQFFY